MTDTLGAAMIRAYLRNQSCADRGGRCDCNLTCRIDADDIIAETSANLRRDIAAIMKSAQKTEGA